MAQTIDLGLAREEIENYLENIGYWSTSDLRKRNAFVLSPSAYVVSPHQRRELNKLSRCAVAGVQALAHRLCEIGARNRMTHEEAFFLALSKNGVRGLLSPREHCGRIPQIMKVDLVQTVAGEYRVAEIDAYNPRGFGYLALLDGTVPATFELAGPGIKALAESIREIDSGSVWTLLVSEYERYYEPIYRVLARKLVAHSVKVRIVGERECAEKGLARDITNLLVVPDTLYDSPEVRSILMENYRLGKLKTYMPPAAFLGSKAFLPYLATCEGLQEFIPRSALVSRRDDPKTVFSEECPLVLKGVMSSGHKQVIFRSREPERFVQEYARARLVKNAAWMLQEEVPQARLPIVVFDESGRRETREIYLRLTAYVSHEGLVGLEATGREVALVHGAPDCIQIPAVLG